LSLVGCAAPTPVRPGPEADTGAARALLAEAAAAGPVRLEANALPATRGGALTERGVESAAARGVRGLDVRFAQPPEASGPARLLLLFDPPPGPRPTQACNAAELPAPLPTGLPLRLRAVFCNGGGYVADAEATASGRTRGEVERLIWRTTGALFPDDYPDSYGVDLFGHRVGFSGSFGF
jgi:hypothetical protein